ncbi:MAG: prephenate dehydrogenase [Phycisphaerales bacterium JB063]
MPFQTQTLVIVGPGLLGTSVALGLRERGFTGQIIGVGRRPETLAQAKQTGGYDELTADLPGAIARASMVLIAVPLSGFRAVFEQIAAHGRPGLIVTDVGSTKASVIADAKAHLADLTRVIGAHPMAGAETQGPAGARADLFVDRPCVLTIAKTDDLEAVRTVEALWQTLGMRLVRMTPKEHDDQVAVVSHMPHLASVMLMRVADQLGGLGVASSGFRDTTRLASSNPPMRADIIEANRESIRNALSAFRVACEEMDRLLETGDRDAITQMLERVKSAREAWLESAGG